MIHLFVLCCAVLAVAISFKNLATYDSRPMISIFWVLSGVLVGPLLVYLSPKLRKAKTKFFVAVSIMTAMLFVGIGFFAKAQFNKERFNQVLLFPKVQARVTSCRVGEESPGRYARPEGRYFPIWNYQYLMNQNGVSFLSHSDSMPDFSIRKHFKSEFDAKAACQTWAANQIREVFVDPNLPELSLLELPKTYRAFNIDLFLSIIFTFFSLTGIYFIIKRENSQLTK